MIRHVFLLAASIGGLTQAVALPPLGGTLVDCPGVSQGLAARLDPAGVRAVLLAPVAMAARANVAAATVALGEPVGVVVVHALGGAKG